MSILIRGMEMPICRTCPCGEEKLYGNLCHITNEIVSFSFDRGDQCPLIEVQPPGRLIDADALLKYCDAVYGLGNNISVGAILNAPTVIESEGEDGEV